MAFSVEPIYAFHNYSISARFVFVCFAHVGLLTLYFLGVIYLLLLFKIMKTPRVFCFLKQNPA